MNRDECNEYNGIEFRNMPVQKLSSMDESIWQISFYIMVNNKNDFFPPTGIIFTYAYSPINIATTPQRLYNSINKDKRFKAFVSHAQDRVSHTVD